MMGGGLTLEGKRSQRGEYPAPARGMVERRASVLGGARLGQKFTGGV